MPSRSSRSTSSWSTGRFHDQASRLRFRTAGTPSREITFYAVKRDGDDDYKAHRINLGLILELIIPSEAGAVSARTQGTGA